MCHDVSWCIVMCFEAANVNTRNKLAKMRISRTLISETPTFWSRQHWQTVSVDSEEEMKKMKTTQSTMEIWNIMKRDTLGQATDTSSSTQSDEVHIN